MNTSALITSIIIPFAIAHKGFGELSYIETHLNPTTAVETNFREYIYVLPDSAAEENLPEGVEFVKVVHLSEGMCKKYKLPVREETEEE